MQVLRAGGLGRWAVSQARLRVTGLERADPKAVQPLCVCS